MASATPDADSDCVSEHSIDLSDVSETIEENCDSNNFRVNTTDGQQIVPYRFEPYSQASDEDSDGPDPEVVNDDVNCVVDIGRLQNTEWCTCNNCGNMPTVNECVCCGEIDVLQLEKEMHGNLTCIVNHPGFTNCCLDEFVLRVANFAYIDHHGHHRRSQAKQHERYRYIAYRQFVRLCWGHLGKEIRVVLPSCVVTKIRQTFPSADYVGFRYACLEG
ncbi:uncharacterized protein [Ptychodera flava]|uniref:uncharacterized protein n=1 Tax=Ptychodera flava TaxID=63121 RepID=UPI00396A83F7